MKKLYKSEKDRVFAGVMGGLGEYFNVDPTVLRVVYTLLVIFTAVVPGLLAYILAAIIMPSKHDTHDAQHYQKHDCDCKHGDKHNHYKHD